MILCSVLHCMFEALHVALWVSTSQNTRVHIFSCKLAKCAHAWNEYCLVELLDSH